MMAHLIVPSILTFCMLALHEILNVVSMGHMGDKPMLSAIGLGNMTINLFAYSIIIGYNNALDTLISQAVGSGNI